MPLLLLDLDNTVADRAAAFDHWVESRLSQWAPADPDARAFVDEQDNDGFTDRLQFLAAVRERFGLTEAVEDLLIDYRLVTLEGFPTVDEGVADRLRTLRDAGWRIGVVTNGDAGVQEATVERIGVAPLIDACVVSGTVGITKPDRRIFEIAAEQCGYPTTGGWMIGDAEADVIGAANTGMRSIWLARGRAWRPGLEPPDVTAADLTEALDVVAAASTPV